MKKIIVVVVVTLAILNGIKNMIDHSNQVETDRHDRIELILNEVAKK